MERASRRAFLCLAASSVATGLLGRSALAANEPAGQLIEQAAREVIDLIKTAQGGPQREAGIRNVLIKYFDLPAMGRASLGKYWDSTTPAERDRFLKAAVNAEARAYSERFGQYGGQTLSVTRVTSRNGASVVDSKIGQSNGQPINIQWEVRDSGQGLRISDVKIEGISMVQTRRSDFNSYISSHGGRVEPLIDELEARAR